MLGHQADQGVDLRLAGEEELLRHYARGRSPAVRDELVRRLLPLARSLALRYRRRSEPLDDLIQVANLGLVKALDGFDPARGRPFAAYAVPTILGELRRHFRDQVWNVRLPRGLQELTARVDEATGALADELGRFPTPAQVAARLDVPVEQVLEAIEAGHARHTASLDAPRSPEAEEAGSIVETLPSTERGFDRVEADLAASGAGLDARELSVLRLRFVDELTQKEIGSMLGVSQMQISRISRRALRKLLGAVSGDATGPPGRSA